jgi:hypothetical protein
MTKRKAAQSRSKASSESPPPARPAGKVGILVELLRREGGATIDAMTSASGWQAHSVRGAMSGAIGKKLGLNVVSEKVDGGRVYRIVDKAVR